MMMSVLKLTVRIAAKLTILSHQARISLATHAANKLQDNIESADWKKPIR